MVRFLIALYILAIPTFGDDFLIDQEKFIYGGESYRLVLGMEDGAVFDVKPQVSCWNPRRRPEVKGSCYIVLEKNGREVSRVNFDRCLFVRQNGKWSSPLKPLGVLERDKGSPLVYFAMYGTCATSIRMNLFWVDKKEVSLKPLVLQSFHGQWKGEIYAQDVEVFDGELWIRAYDHSVGNVYMQFSLVDDGVYDLTGYYTQAGGTFSLAEEILRKKRKERVY